MINTTEPKILMTLRKQGHAMTVRDIIRVGGLKSSDAMVFRAVKSLTDKGCLEKSTKVFPAQYSLHPQAFEQYVAHAAKS